MILGTYLALGIHGQNDPGGWDLREQHPHPVTDVGLFYPQLGRGQIGGNFPTFPGHFGGGSLAGVCQTPGGNYWTLLLYRDLF